MAWTFADAPLQSGKTFLITGANSGIGLEAAWMLADLEGHVILACRSEEKIARAKQDIRKRTSRGTLDGVVIDLASLRSVCDAATAIKSLPILDVLVNNAGVMMLPRTLTEDGFEMQLGTNHLGHFALTAAVFDHLAPDGRVVNVSSNAHKPGRIAFDDLMGEKRYSKFGAYCQSKLANLLFTVELQRRFDAGRSPRRAVACHPGYTSTNLLYVGPRMEKNRLMEMASSWANRLVAQSAEHGAWPSVRAAVEPTLNGAEYFGPNGPLELYGKVEAVSMAPHARDPETAERFWKRSLELTGARFHGLPSSLESAPAPNA